MGHSPEKKTKWQLKKEKRKLDAFAKQREFEKKKEAWAKKHLEAEKKRQEDKKILIYNLRKIRKTITNNLEYKKEN